MQKGCATSFPKVICPTAAIIRPSPNGMRIGLFRPVRCAHSDLADPSAMRFSSPSFTAGHSSWVML
jgi:hypothetical protein